MKTILLLLSILSSTAAHAWEDSPFCKAVIDGNQAEVEKLLPPKDQIDATNCIWWRTPTVVAIRAGNFELARFLLEHGSDINFKNFRDHVLLETLKAFQDGDKYAYNPKLHACNSKCRIDFLRYLFSKNPTMKTGYSFQESDPLLLEVARLNPDDAVEALPILKTAGVNLNGYAFKGKMNLLHLIMGSFGYNRAKVVQKLVELGVDINAQDDEGWTPLVHAIAGKYAENAYRGAAVNLILSLGGDPSIRSKTTNTPLIIAVTRTSGLQPWENPVGALLYYHPDPNARGEKGQTALMLAAERGSINNIIQLIKAGADKNLKDDEGKTAKDYAAANYRKDAVELLSWYLGQN